MMKQVVFGLAAIGLWLATAVQAEAGVIYDAANDFSITNGNPNGAWSYGYFAPSTTTPLIPYTMTSTAFNGNPAWIAWNISGDTSVPAAFKNTSGVAQQTGTVLLQAGQLAEHPGPNGEVAIVRWTAPASGTIMLNTTFSAADVGPFQNGTTTDVHVLDNGVSIFDGAVNGYASSTSLSMTRAVVAGETIDFATGFGSDRTYFNDSSGLSATINLTAAVPEPSSFILLGVGAVGLIGSAWRRRQRSV
jgi:hypothetical protein